MDKKRVYKQAFFLILGFIISFMGVKVHATTEDISPRIFINLPSRTLELYRGETLIKEYSIAIGKPSTPTPIGEFTIIEKEENPCWYPPGKKYIVPSGPENPLGYRWMGIAPMYGIHGTNAPWSIGAAVSNGCIRMQEEDVEDLFERVAYNTPVKVEYERVKVRINGRGIVSIGIYPDVYGYKNITLSDVKVVMAKAGLEGLADENFLTALLHEVPDRQVEIAQIHKLKINGERCTEYAVTWKGKKMIPVMALASRLNTPVNWDESKQTISRQNQVVPAMKVGNSVYINLEHFPVIFGGREVWNDKDNCLELALPVTKFEGQIISGDIHRQHSEWLVPALTIANLLGERVKWLPDKGELVVHGRVVPITAYAGQPYINNAGLGQALNIAAVWDEELQTLELHYPLYPIDYSMYLDPGEEFF